MLKHSNSADLEADNEIKQKQIENLMSRVDTDKKNFDTQMIAIAAEIDKAQQEKLDALKKYEQLEEQCA